MNLNKVSAGKNIPEDIYVIIEIPYNSAPVKYEINKENHIIFVDRFIPTSMFYPCNYGYINNTLSSDGDPLDVLVLSTYSIISGAVIRCRPIGMLKMIDESGIDNKIIAIPHYKITKEYDNINDINDLPLFIKTKIIHFFEHYKDLEDNKWIKIDGWSDVNDAKFEISNSFNKFKKL